MSWIPKFDQLKSVLGTKPELAVMFGATVPAPEAFCEALMTQYPFVSPGYLQYLEHTDGGHFDMFLLFGSPESPYSSAIEETSKRAKSLGRHRVPVLQQSLVIGSDPLADAIMLAMDGTVYLGGRTIHDAALIAPSFDAFLDSYLLGPHYSSLIDAEMLPNEWWQLLQEYGWV